MWTLNVLSPTVWPALSLSTMSGVAGRGEEGRQPVVVLDDLVGHRRRPGCWPGQRIISGTRNAPSQFVFFSLRNGVVPASGQLFMCGPLSVL